MLLDCSRHTVGQVLSTVSDHVPLFLFLMNYLNCKIFIFLPGDTVLCCEGAGTGTQAGQGGQVRAQAEVQRDHARVNPHV